MSTTRWPRSWNSRSFWRTTVWPRWMSGAVGSSPSLTRSGRPSRAAVASLASSAPAGRLSTALRARNAASVEGSAIRPNAILGRSRPGLRRLARGCVRAVPGARVMSVAEPPSITPLPLPESGPRPPRPKVKKLRLTLIVLGLGGLALVSTVFGMMMAVASDLPQLENEPRFRHARNSTLLDAHGRSLGLVVSNQNLVLVGYDQISPAMRHAIISIEDRRFYTNSGVDIRGIARAFVQDVVHKGSVQGGSTITQQFVKNALEAQGNRTVFQKLREAALAYHLTRKWSKEKILTEYLNAIYFGNGAYGVESAARVYFGGKGAEHEVCGTRGQPNCASLLRPEEAALLAGMVSTPSAYDPVAHWPAAMARRNVVLRKMLDQGFITRSDYQRGL